jgi:hypothetical protein
MMAAAFTLLGACGGRIAGDDGGPGSNQPPAERPEAGDGLQTGTGGTGTMPPDARTPDFACPVDPPPIGGACGLTPPNNGCVYFPGGVCTAYLCTSSAWAMIACP